jgi:hypothetical protein
MRTPAAGSELDAIAGGDIGAQPRQMVRQLSQQRAIAGVPNTMPRRMPLRWRDSR